MSRVARTIVRRNVERNELVVRGLERQLAEHPPASPREELAARQLLLRGYQAWEQAAAAAGPFYREHSGARAFAESTARLLATVIELTQRELDRTTAGV